MKSIPESDENRYSTAGISAGLPAQFFNPRSVAVIGAAREEGKVGHVIFDSLITGFSGKVFAVNPNAKEIHSHPTFKSVTDIPEPVDLAVIVVPAKFVPSVIEECGRAGIKAAVIISAGFKETGIDGSHLEAETLAAARRWDLRFIGPNCLGLINTANNLNASFAGSLPEEGNIAFMSQSGALCTAILDWAEGESVGFSKFVSLGNKADVSEIELLESWRDDPLTNVVSVYMEGIGNGRAFLDAAASVSKIKPIIAIKSGSTDAGAKAVSSHTGTLAGSESVYKAAFGQAGIVQAESVESLFDFALGFSYQAAPAGRRLAIITNAGGPGIMATDACERAGLNLAQFSDATIKILKNNLPAEANIYNPVDVLGDALADRYMTALTAVVSDSEVDAVLVLLTPQAMTDIKGTARAIAAAARTGGKPIFTSFMGKVMVDVGVAILKEEKIPNYYFPERAVRTIAAMAEWRERRDRPSSRPEKFIVNKEAVKEVIGRARLRDRTWLPDSKASDILQAYGIGIPRKGVARSAAEAIKIAREIGYPVAAKVASPDILHKSDIGAIRLNIGDDEGMTEAFETIEENVGRFMPDAAFWGVTVSEMVTGAREVIVGVNRDPQFGPLIMFGLGGIYVEVLKDVTFRIAPLTGDDAVSMIQEIKSYLLLRGVRGETRADIDSIIDTILRISQLVMDFPEIIEMDINPLMVKEKGGGSVAADVRISLGSD